MTAFAPPEVTLAESIPLVAAFASRLAADHGIRLLLIKGQPATDLGVRADRPSVDVDVLVAPEGLARFTELLEMRGWTLLPGPPAGVAWGHAQSMSHPRWACTIDVHAFVPGLLASPELVFDEMWSRRGACQSGGRSIATPDLAAALAISGLHGLRSKRIPETAEDLACVVRVLASLPPMARHDFLNFALMTQSAEPLRPLLERAGIATPLSVPPHESLRVWRVRTQYQGVPTIGWILAMKAAGPRSRLRLLWEAMRPTEQDFTDSGGNPATARGHVRAFRHRIGRAVGAAPILARWARAG